MTISISLPINKMLKDQYSAVRQGAGFLDRSFRGRIVVKGNDRVDYLQGLLTNDIAALRQGDGCYSAYLTAQGRLIADLDLFNLGNSILMDVHGDMKTLLIERFRELVFAEDIDIEDWTETYASLGLYGPMSLDVLGIALKHFSDTTDCSSIRHLQPYQCLNLSTKVGRIIVARTDELGELGFSIFVEENGSDSLSVALVEAGGVEINQETKELVRVESGRPAFPEDMDNKIIPLEAGIADRAISESKGCYVGQEVIIRILHRGQGRVAKQFVGLMLRGSGEVEDENLRVPERGSALLVGDEVVGHVTSAVWSPTLLKVIVLGYLQRAFLKPGLPVLVEFGDDRAEAIVMKLPFVTTSLRDWRP
jgi:folate-binding protein YgfZ